PPDAEQPGNAARVRPDRAVRRNSVVHDPEGLLGEALGVGEVARQPARDRDVHVREARDRAVTQREGAALAELVETVLRRDAHRYPSKGAGQLPIRIRVDEVRVQDARTDAGGVADEAQ